ncbi:G2E3 ligase, partial [Hemiprocne comata]|nr:G2E3 ligase [Hemiprocne comata]
CFICGQSGATITCQETGCDRSFHLPCAAEGECVTQYLAPFRYLLSPAPPDPGRTPHFSPHPPPSSRAFCWEHRPQQAVEAAPEENTICIICLDPVGDRMTYSTLVCPVCQHTWFHRGCIQVEAVPSPPWHGRCWAAPGPHSGSWQQGLIWFPFSISLPSWDAEAFAELTARHSRCDAWECLCPGGREQVEEEGPWQLLLCSSCAAEGTHRCCSSLMNSTASWECDSC